MTATLSRVGPSGQVVGVNRDAQQLAAAHAYFDEERLTNVELLDSDAYATGLLDASFDLVHVHFLFVPVGRDDELLSEMSSTVAPTACGTDTVWLLSSFSVRVTVRYWAIAASATSAGGEHGSAE